MGLEAPSLVSNLRGEALLRNAIYQAKTSYTVLEAFENLSVLVFFSFVCSSKSLPLALILNEHTLLTSIELRTPTYRDVHLSYC